MGSASTTSSKKTLAGERISFTGRLGSMTRREAGERIERLGGVVTPSVTSRTTMLVVGMHGWPLRSDGGVSAKLRQAERLQSSAGPGGTARIRVVPEVELLERLGLRAPAEATEKTFSPERVAEIVGVGREVIERWERLGLVRSVGGACDFRDIVSLQTIADLTTHGVALETIQNSLTSLASILPGTDRPLAQLRIVDADAGELLTQIGDALVAPDGQQVLDFAGVSRDSAPGGGGARPIDQPESADELFDKAVALEEGERYEEAAEAYRRVFALEPGRSDALFNLGNTQRMLGRIEAAEEAFRLAEALDPANVLAQYNLADLLEETGRVEEAVLCLGRAVGTDAAFADAHFNLALCLEKLGRADEAGAHWRAYLRLDTASEWARVAREHLAKMR